MLHAKSQCYYFIGFSLHGKTENDQPKSQRCYIEPKDPGESGSYISTAHFPTKITRELRVRLDGIPRTPQHPASITFYANKERYSVDPRTERGDQAPCTGFSFNLPRLTFSCSSYVAFIGISALLSSSAGQLPQTPELACFWKQPFDILINPNSNPPKWEGT
jgi:hypothetical protein